MNCQSLCFGNNKKNIIKTRRPLNMPADCRARQAEKGFYPHNHYAICLKENKELCLLFDLCNQILL